MTPEKRPQDPHMDGTGLRFETLDHGGEYPDTMPQAIKLTDARAGPPSMCRSRKTARWSTARALYSMRTMMTGDVCFGVIQASRGTNFAQVERQRRKRIINQ